MKKRNWKKTLLIGAAFTLLIASALAFAPLEQASAAAGELIDEIQHRFPFGPGPKGENNGYLAEALGITTDELSAAQEEAFQNQLTAAVADGKITLEQANLMLANKSLQEYIDNEALMAEVLGLSVDELQAAREDGATMETLLEDAGLTREEFRTALQAAHEAALQDAIDAGIITAEQAESLQNQGPRGDKDGMPFGGGKGHRSPGGERPEGFERPGSRFPGGPEDTEGTDTDTNF